MVHKKSIVIVGMGNLHSVTRALEYVCSDNITISLSHDPKMVAEADAIVFPGQGAAKSCMGNLTQHPGLVEQLLKSSQEKPFLGICMGMQVLLSHSEENNGIACLDKITGTVKPFQWDKLQSSSERTLKIPHMGWNSIEQQEHPLWHNIPNQSCFYFVHSYYCDNADTKYTAGTTHYGHAFTSAIADKNWFAIQAHPEKSGEAGLQLLKNFCSTL